LTRRARGLRFAFAAAVLLPHGAARANGRYPVANQLVVAPGDSSYLVLRSTFGILQSSDGGKSWSWICEQAAGYNDDDEPAVAVTADGSIVVGSEGLTASHNRGCSWSMPDEFGVSTIVTDLDVDRSAPHHLVALSGKGDGMVGYTNRVLESLDDGRTWVPLGNAIANGLIAETIEIAPSGRVYLSGIHPPSGFLVRSGDAGATWTELPIAGPDGSIPFIAAVDTSNSDRIYVRSKAGDSDRLFVTSNSGESWTEIFSLPGSILGFALSPDGRRVAVGGPALGISVAGTTDYVFRRVSMVGAYCLRWTEAGLYACAKPFGG
jgi:photosystem II stability/assembly factor-like uncharacterized protein